MKVRVRIAPSPTGLAHIGTIYTALFNYAFAKQQKGEFVLRIEDTDVQRHVPEAEKVISEALRWVSLEYDEGPDIGGSEAPYRQSERLELYKNYAQQLLKKNLAYKDEGAIRFKVPSGQTSWQDLIRDKITWQNDQVKDFVILKSDGYPTYNFAVVIDDWQMKISHVIRAEDHTSNTPRQIMIYRALGIEPPQFAHLPLLRNPDHSKISKRKNPVAISWYQEQGYLPKALINFLCLLGWSHPQEKDVFPVSEFIKTFSFERISTSAPIFDLKKLDWLNGVYIRKKSDKELVQLLKPFAPKGMNSTLIEKTIPLIKERIEKLSDYSNLIDFLVKEPKIKKRKLTPEQSKIVLKTLSSVKTWQAEELEKVFRGLVKKHDWPIGKFFMAIRLDLTGKKVTPPLFESMELLGRQKTMVRLQHG